VKLSEDTKQQDLVITPEDEPAVILASKQGERVQVWSRRGASFAYRFPAIAPAARRLSVAGR
jgi:hypothetical protein